jgi:hypothetical protein
LRLLFDEDTQAKRLVQLHRKAADHAGILCVFHDDDASKSMSYRDIGHAPGNLADAGLELAGTFLALNAWRY